MLWTFSTPPSSGRPLRAGVAKFMSDMRLAPAGAGGALGDGSIPNGSFQATERGHLLLPQWAHCATLVERGAQSELVDALRTAAKQLFWVKRQQSADDWSETQSLARLHPLYRILHSDPLVRGARKCRHPLLAQPKLLDLICGSTRARKVLSVLDPIGCRLFAYSVATDRSKAIRHLIQTIAEQILATVAETEGARIATLGCGYLRELGNVPWHSQIPIDLFLATDRNNKAVSRLRKLRLHQRLTCVSAHLWEAAHHGLVAEGREQNGFHLIYSLNALDGSDEVTAEKLLGRMAKSLAPGGRLLLYNSRSSSPDAVFQETFLAQKPFARTRTDLEYLLRHVRSDKSYDTRVDEVCGEEFMKIVVDRLKLN